MINIIGLACGPALTGLLSDLLEPRYGIRSLGYAMLIASFLLAGAAFCFWRGSRDLEADLARSREASAREARGLA